MNKLFLSDPQAFRKVLLTPFQIDALNLIKTNNITTSEQLTDESELCRASAGAILTLLFKKGYLKRTSVVTKNRGKYIYEVCC